MGCAGSKKPKEEPFDKFQIDITALHNKYRAKHNAKELTNNKELTEKAMEWASKLAEDGKLSFPDVYEKENIHVSVYSISTNVPEDRTAEALMAEWYKKKNNYNFDAETLGGQQNTAYFTQMVWKDTQEIGVGYKMKDEDTIYLSVYYRPAGNILQKFAENVEKEISS